MEKYTGPKFILSDKPTGTSLTILHEKGCTRGIRLCASTRRALARLNCAELPVWEGQLRKRISVTAHLWTGVRAHRRQKAGADPTKTDKAA